MVALNPIAVEPKFRPLAFCMLVVIGLFIAVKVGIDMHTSYYEDHVVSSRMQYGPLPNIWLCSWNSDGADGKLDPMSVEVKIPGSWQSMNATIHSERREWSFPSHGGPTANGECAFFQTSVIANPVSDIFLKLKAQLTTWGTAMLRHCVVYAESPASKGLEAQQSEVGWTGATDTNMPILYSSIFKNVVGNQGLLEQRKRPQYTGAVRGIYNVPDTISNNEVEVWLQLETTAGGVPGVMEHLKLSTLQKLIGLLTALGGVFAIVGGVFAVFFVQKHPHSFQLTLRTPAYQRFAKREYDAKHEGEKDFKSDDFFSETCCDQEEEQPQALTMSQWGAPSSQTYQTYQPVPLAMSMPMYQNGVYGPQSNQVMRMA